MKKMFLIITLAILTVCSTFPVSAYYSHTKKTKINGNDFKYRVIDNKYIEIVEGVGFIPEQIDGLPVTMIGDGAYRDSDDEFPFLDKNWIIPDTVTYIGNYAFMENSAIEKISIPSSVTHIGTGAFMDCYNLESVSIATSVLTIPAAAFSYCTKLKTVKLPYSLRSIGDSAFFYCSRLSEINMPESLWGIGKAAFYNCKALKKIDFSNVTGMGIVGERALGYCYNKKQSLLYYDSKKAKNSSILKGFKIICEPDWLAGDAPARYALENNIPLTYNVNSESENTFMGEIGAGDTAKINIDGKSLSDFKAKNSKIAKITKNGKVTGLKKGKTNITVTLSNGKKYTGSFYVISNPELSKSSVSVKKGKTVSVKVLGKASSIKNKYTNTKYAKIVSKNTASTLKIKGLINGTTTLKVNVNGVAIKLKVVVK